MLVMLYTLLGILTGICNMCVCVEWILIAMPNFVNESGPNGENSFGVLPPAGILGRFGNKGKHIWTFQLRIRCYT